MSFCFEAPAAAGTLRIALPEAGTDPIDAALALAEHEPLVTVLETWLQQALDPLPVPRFDVSVPLLWVDVAGARLGLPWPLLLAAPGAPALPVPWPELEFEVEVAAFETSPLPQTAAGGVLMLPPSFQPAWRVVLRNETLLAEAEWPGPGAALSLCAPPEPRVSQRPPWTVALSLPWRQALPELLGWVPATEPPRPDAAAWLVGPAGPLRRGRIAPALAGAGLWLDD